MNFILGKLIPLLVGPKWYHITPQGDSGSAKDFAQKYNEIADVLFGIALPVMTGVAITVCVVFAILTGIKMSKANSAEEKNNLKKKLIWNIAGLVIVALATVAIPAISTWIFKAVQGK